MTLTSVKSIMQKRALINPEMAGKLVELFIQGNGNTIDVKDSSGELVQSVAEPGTVLRKMIFNCRANSGLAMQNDRNRQLLKAGATAERTGAKVSFDLGEGAKEYSADELLSAYLNRVQFTFSVLLNGSTTLVDKLSNGVLIKGVVQRIEPTAERKAEQPNATAILTIDSSTISLVAAEKVGTTTFDIDDILGEEETVAAPEAIEA